MDMAMRKGNVLILVWIIFLIAASQNCMAQSDIGKSRSAIITSLTKATFRIIKNTEEKLTGEFPDPKIYYEYYFKNNICYLYEGLIPVSEKEYYISEMKRNGWVYSHIYDNDLYFNKGEFTLKVITLSQGIGYFKFQFSKN